MDGKVQIRIHVESHKEEPTADFHRIEDPIDSIKLQDIE